MSSDIPWLKTQTGRSTTAFGIGVVATLVLLFANLDWYFEVKDLDVRIARVISVASIPVAIGALLQAGAHHEDGHRFMDQIGKYLVAAGASLTAIVGVASMVTLG